jgi:hypothetical protein
VYLIVGEMMQAGNTTSLPKNTLVMARMWDDGVIAPDQTREKLGPLGAIVILLYPHCKFIRGI